MSETVQSPKKKQGERNIGAARTFARSSTDLAKFAPPTDADSLADALIAGQLSPRTRKAYASDLAELLSVLEMWGLPLRDVNRDHLHAFRSYLAGEAVIGLERKARPCAPATISRKVSVVRQLFGEAFDRGMIPANPAARLRGFSVSDESKTLGLSPDQARDILGRIDTGALIGLRDRAMLSLMIRTGVRRMDVIGATVGNLGESQGHKTLNVKRSKGNKDRTVKLPVQLWRDLEAWREAAGQWRSERPGGSTPLFCAVVKTGRGKDAIYKVYGDGENAGQTPLSEKAIWKIVVKRAGLAGIRENITPHSTRHTFITLALDGGASLHKVQAAAGHADPRTTERYWRTKQNLDDNAVDYIRL
jgi:integrase/recombinase XerD